MDIRYLIDNYVLAAPEYWVRLKNCPQTTALNRSFTPASRIDDLMQEMAIEAWPRRTRVRK